jgi:hypothetical protein
MSRFILSILFLMLAAGLCGLSHGQDADPTNAERLVKENQAAADNPVVSSQSTTNQPSQQNTITNAFNRSLAQDSTRASDIQTRVDSSNPKTPGHARAYYEPDATYSDPSLTPMLSPFPRTRSLLTSESLESATAVKRVNEREFEFGTIMTFPAIAEDESELNKKSNFSLASTPLQSPLTIVESNVIEISTISPNMVLFNQPNLFEIQVRNRSTKRATNIIVQMEISKNLALTGFDRLSWVDEARRTVSWEIDSLDGGTETVIRFRGQSNAIGRDTQQITVGMENRYQGQCELVTEVVTPVDNNDPENTIRNN